MSSDPPSDDVQSAEAPPHEPVRATRRWLVENQVATLSTTSVTHGLEGYPYGSVVPFALDPAGRPVILISSLASHTKNLLSDPRGALLVRQPDPGGDPQTGWRVSLLGTWRKVIREEPERAMLHARYRERVANAVTYDGLRDFDYWRMEDVVKVRYIAGFGKITWLPGHAVAPPRDETWPVVARGAVDHMNEDHSHNLIEMCRGRYGLTPERAEMVQMDRDGFLVRTEGPEDTLFFSFGRDVTPQELRVAVIDVLKAARAAAQA